MVQCFGHGYIVYFGLFPLSEILDFLRLNHIIIIDKIIMTLVVARVCVERPWGTRCESSNDGAVFNLRISQLYRFEQCTLYLFVQCTLYLFVQCTLYLFIQCTLYISLCSVYPMSLCSVYAISLCSVLPISLSELTQV